MRRENLEDLDVDGEIKLMNLQSTGHVIWYLLRLAKDKA
jgi:hypothetical protein